MDKPAETRPASEVSAGRRQWPSLDNVSDEDLVSFLGLDRNDRVSTGKQEAHPSPDVSGQRDQADDQPERATSAPELTGSELRHWRDALPPVDSPRERGKPTTAAVFDSGGMLGFDVSGGRLENGEVDPRVETAKDWMAEAGWALSANQVEKHVEAKVVVDMIQGRLSNHVTLVVNNELCPEEADYIDVVSCEAFIRDSLPVGHSLRVYDTRRSSDDPWYFEGGA